MSQSRSSNNRRGFHSADAFTKLTSRWRWTRPASTGRPQPPITAVHNLQPSTATDHCNGVLSRPALAIAPRRQQLITMYICMLLTLASPLTRGRPPEAGESGRPRSAAVCPPVCVSRGDSVRYAAGPVTVVDWRLADWEVTVPHKVPSR